ncbi:histidinol phosphate aminotransferase [Flavobacterium beibuense F44-8]|uniref:Histidinol-phosphate aminotransferase n=1 Tax=Flavobacterium beibuense F44-8 TaxID=1406840 RepID=A0A0A2LIP2_9FLAO|nr:histidinol-phosphate transaminase [Flavobacterium beibuense]KGO80087.1 histidinol phosphate aminotransferase [Flavobacterium beibuense F44-8]
MNSIEKIVRPNILALQAYSSAREEFTGSEGIFLDANENPFGELNRYPDPLQKALKQKLSVIKGVATQNIFTGNGSDEAIDLCFRIFCEPGKDKALTFTPTYGMYEVSAAINNTELIKVPLDNNFQVDINKVLLALEDENLKLVFICSPNNPTGNCLDAAEFIIQNFKGIVVVDEAYADFCSTTLVNKLEQYSNLIVLQTLSKAWGLAAARVGIAYASPFIISLFNKVKPPYNISKLNYTAAIYALENTDNYEEQKKLLLEERLKLSEALSQIPIVRKVYPSQANFLLVEVSDANSVYKNLIQQGIIIRNRNKEVKNCIRISIGTPQENKALLNALQNITA